ncbi:DUF6090 family protein [Psychroserpens sp. BH13MA-6]
MIKFFRKIRQNSLAEGKTGKYLKYAVGEIVLVVIGILIALQINNANENIKKTEFEITILENIKEDILADKVDCELNLQYLKTTVNNEQLLLDFLLNDSIQESDKISYVDALGVDLITVFHNASFNNLQNNDIGLIKNNTLYKKITRYYDFYVSALKELENNHKSANTYDEKLIFFRKHFKVIDKKVRMDLSDEEAWKQEWDRYNFAVKDIESLRKDEEFKILLAESLFVNRILVDYYLQLFKKIEDLNKSIDNELRTLKK